MLDTREEDVASDVLSIFIESCLWNIAQTDVQSIELAIQRFQISVEVTTIFSVDILDILNQLLALSCPGQPMCGGHGHCEQALCVCDEGCSFCHHSR